ncbi:MAG: glycosyltransferase family 4 protein [Lentimicrobium sp.]|jgi:glycosyltransferase involved in cell wall biosynthesis|nr:glycosyltransferase family 4 protein [Lentimicrobium sp.]MDD4598825.1 glycosyltransferase family 4 protein [Lentimicrobiaceae bacterium]MDY0026436.1 glycosyltransferase family 4 protein [Lentimicrobium sp.]
MKILMLCNKSPWPPSEGGPMAMEAMASGLMKAGHQVKILAINSNKYHTDLKDIPKAFREQTGIEFVYIDLSIKPLPALYSLIRGTSYHVERFITADFARLLEQILIKDNYDIIQFETLFTSPYIELIRKYSQAKLILRAHNIEHLIWERISNGTRNPLKRFYLRRLAKALGDYEKQTLKKLDGVVAITDVDSRWFRQAFPRLPVVSIPFGIDAGDEEEDLTTIEPEIKGLFHLGSMNWMPNQEGIRWFLTEVWPGLREQFPELTFSLAGRSMPQWLLQNKQPGIIIDGEVADARRYMLEHQIMVVPLFSGSGIRIKIIEGMLMGKPVITTPVGAEGIHYVDGEHLIIARNAAEFIDAIALCINQPLAARQMGIAGRKLVLYKHDNQMLMQILTDFYQQISG